MNELSRQRIDTFINGTNTQYAAILSAIRENLQEEIPTIYGCITFYNYDVNTNKMLMKVFPYKEDVIDKHFPDDINIISHALERINTDRPYERMHHLKNFRKKYMRTSHTSLSIPESEVLIHSNETINGKSWSDFLIDDNIEDNTLDNLLFESGSQDFTIIPLPVLSSPCILLIIPIGGNTKGAMKDIIVKAHSSIEFYLYNQLLREIRKDLKPGQIKDKKELIKRFLLELSQVLIPIKYEYDGCEYRCFDWYGGWNTSACVINEIELANEIIKFYMPTFCWGEGEMYHLHPHYKSGERRTRETVVNIFELVFGHWQTLNSKKVLMEQEISPLITELKENISNLNIAKAKVQNEIINQTNKIKELSSLVLKLGGDTTQPWENEFYSKDTPDGERIWKFRYKGIDIIQGGDMKGFEGLHRIMSNKGSIISVSDLMTSSFVSYEDLENPFGIKNEVYAGQEGFEFVYDKIIDPSIIKTKKNYEAEIKKYELRLDSNCQDLEFLKSYAINLAGYINCCKDIPGFIGYKKEKEALLKILPQIEGKTANYQEYEMFVESLTETKKQSMPNSADKSEKDRVTASIRNAVKELKAKGGSDVDTLFGKNILKIGVESYFRPQNDLDVLWKFHEDD